MDTPLTVTLIYTVCVLATVLVSVHLIHANRHAKSH